MNKENYNQIRLGFFVVAGAALLIIGLYLIGNKKNIFSETYTLYTRVYDVSGLQKGNNVRFSGIDVGTVTGMEFTNDTSILITMVIEKDLSRFIRKNSVTSIGTDGLMGNRLLNIEPGTVEAPLAQSGDELPTRRSLDTDKMLRTLDITNRNVSLMSEDLRHITRNIQQSNGTLYSLFLDTSLAGSLKNTLINLENISTQLNSFSGNLNSVAQDVKQGKGVIGSLVLDSSELNKDLHQAISSIRKSGLQLDSVTREVRFLLSQVREGKGSTGLLISDTATANHLRKTIANIDTSAEMMNEYMKALRGNVLFRSYFRKAERAKSDK